MRPSVSSIIIAGFTALGIVLLYLSDDYRMKGGPTFNTNLERALTTNIQLTKERRIYPKPIIILSYMRSGSTFLGDVIQSSPEVFYVFEPLWTLHTSSPPYMDLHGNKIEGNTEGEIGRNIIDHVYACRLSNLPEKFFTNHYFLNVSLTTRNFTTCSRYRTRIQCAEELGKRCLMSKFILIKTVRVEAYEMFDLKNQYPELKVIYLLRDPRAVLKSQKKFGRFNTETAEAFAKTYCASVSHDTQFMRVFQNIFPDSICVIYYEMFTQNAMQMSQKLYHCLEMSLDTTTLASITELTRSSNCSRITAICTSAVETSVAADAWRSDIPFSLVQTIDRCCKELYTAHGFIPFNITEHLMNTSFPSQNASISILKYLH